MVYSVRSTPVKAYLLKKGVAIFLLLFLVGGAVVAQKGSNEIKVIAEGAFSIPVSNSSWSNDFISGYGGFIKGYYGIGHAGQLTAMIGITKFTNNNSYLNSKTNTHMIPVLLGYKQHLKLFYIEPQAGLGEMGGKISWGTGDESRPSVTTVFAGLGAGVDIKRFELGLRYQYAKGIDSPEAGIWSTRSFELLGLHAGYRIF